MDNVSYILASQRANLFKAMDRVSDQVANVNTTGYKAEKDVFSQILIKTDGQNKASFSTIKNTVRDDSQGNLIATARDLDVAIKGEGYFMVDTPMGKRFTRSGNLQINSEGVLVTNDGYHIIGPGGGKIEFAQGDTNINIKEDGSILAGNAERGQIGVYIFDYPQTLQRLGNGLYKATEVEKIASGNYQIFQGMLESSNVNSVTSMTNLVSLSRSIETIKSMQKDYHETQMGMIRKLSQQ
ncbi:flagellar basal-body rod protein FlgF [Rickettsiales bacterium]|nr:flagellar basal-body rod protein FlgF [Rickettsiales bacterium]